VGIFGGLFNLHVQLSSVEFHVLVSGNAPHIQLPSRHTDVEIRGLRHFHGDMEIVVRTIFNLDLGVGCCRGWRGNTEPYAQVLTFGGLSRLKGQADLMPKFP